MELIKKELLLRDIASCLDVLVELKSREEPIEEIHALLIKIKSRVESLNMDGNVDINEFSRKHYESNKANN
jgi:hypothetical protein